MGSVLKLTIIIVSYNVRDELRTCLHALQSQLDTMDATIIVVDNASTDDTDQMMRSEFPQVTFHQNPRNSGFASANNIGIELNNSEYVMCLNPDTVPLENAITNLVHTLETHPEAAAVGPRAYWDEEKQFLISSLKIPTPIECWLTHSVASRFSFSQRLFSKARQTDWNYWTNTDPAFPVPAIGGAYLMVRRSALNAVGGGFDPAYFLGYEDVDLCRKFTQKGYTLLCCPQAEIVHYYGASKRKNPKQVAHCLNWKTEAQQYLVKQFGRFHAGWVGSFLDLEKRVRAVRSSRSIETPTQLNKTRQNDIHLTWDATDTSKYLVEIATSPCFYDKFGHFTTSNNLHIDSATLSNLTPGVYYWRVFQLPLQTNSKPVFQDRFMIP